MRPMSRYYDRRGGTQKQNNTAMGDSAWFLAGHVFSTRHRQCQSEEPAGIDSLIGMCYYGWRISLVLAYGKHATGTRHVIVYHFCLKRGRERVTVRVINKLGVSRAIRENDFQSS